ncbi:ATP-binding protein [Caedibacter taeniospiralis]|uniref:ATP-binding protein n=1 Tax=Caedibacter taeniospiralis TaxID=28907 RepID=UPI0013023BEB|nr:AAA family ATPase [Caedibacter taeniospiralis]
MFKRILKLNLPERQSTFLWGARRIGKSSYLKHVFPDAKFYDLLNTDLLIKLSKSPHILREEVLAFDPLSSKKPVIIDEVQKIPGLMNEVHWLIENAKTQFILCGSSARALKTQSTNLLGGRAWVYHFYPLTFAEIPQFDLLKALQQGLIPDHYLSRPEYIQQHLQAYIDVYLTDEIRNEGLVRNLPGFARFLDVAGMTNGELINMSNIARDCGIDRSTVQNFYQILIDTLLGYFIYPFRTKIKRDLITATPKFYFFDVAIANYLAGISIQALKGAQAGRSFEHYIMMELMAYKGLVQKQFTISYWRTKSGLEVDFVLGNAQVAIEVKISSCVKKSDLKGLIAFCEEHQEARAIVVSQDEMPRKILDPVEIDILPWKVFLDKLYKGEII